MSKMNIDAIFKRFNPG